LVERYPDPEESLKPGDPYGIGMWMIENMVADRFPRRDDAPEGGSRPRGEHPPPT
jgi:hypothetical protein